MSSELIQKACVALRSYYKSKNTQYDDLFQKFVDENGYDDDLINREFEQSPSQCVLLEFFVKRGFPGAPNEKDEKEKYILMVLELCWKSPSSFVKKDNSIASEG